MAVALCTALPDDAQAQRLQASVSHYSTLDGLASSSVGYITQDDYGYLWLATWNGLSRFDGDNFYNYRTGNGSHIPNMHNRIQDLTIDGSQNVWMRMYDGRVFVVDRTTDRIVNPFGGVSGGDEFHTSTSMMATSSADVLISIDDVGLFIMRIDKGGIRHQLVNSDRYNITAMTEGYQGDIWLGTNKGVHRLDLSNMSIERSGVFINEQITCLYSNGYNIYGGTRSGKIIFFAYGQEPRVLYQGADRITSIFTDSHGLVWFCDAKEGALRLNTETNNVKRFTQVVPVPQHDGDGGKFREACGYVWVRMNHGGYGYYNRETDEVEYFHNNPNDSWNLNNSINASLELDEGVIWESTARKGLEKLELVNKTIRRRRLVENPTSTDENETRAMYLDHKTGNLYVGTKAGVLYVFNKGGRTNTLSHDSQGKPFGRFYGINKGRQERLLLCSKDNGLYVMDQSGHTTHYCHDVNNRWSMNNDAAYGAVEDKYGNIWIATYGGGVNVITFPKGADGRKQTQVLNPDNAMRHYPINGFRKVRTVEIDREGNIWAGTTDGMLVMTLKNGKMTTQKVENSTSHPDNILMSNDVVTMARDPKGTLWIGTNGGGLSRVIGKDSDGRYLFENYGAEHGLPSEEIRGITFDEQGKVWFSTDNLICSFEPQRGIFSTYTSLDGVDDTQISEGAAVTRPDGNVLFGTLDGYYVIDRQKLTDTSGASLKLRITDFFLNEELMSPRLNNQYDYYVPDARSVSLPSHNSNIEIRFAALNYQLQHRVHYMYMMEGYEHSWKNANREHSVSYNMLPSGTYRFRVKAFLLESPEKYDMRTLEIIVPPPFLLSSGAVWLYMIIGISVALWIMFHIQNRKWRKYHPDIQINFWGQPRKKLQPNTADEERLQAELKDDEEILDDNGIEMISDEEFEEMK